MLKWAFLFWFVPSAKLMKSSAFRGMSKANEQRSWQDFGIKLYPDVDNDVFFTTCQVRVVSFSVSCCPPSSPLPAPPRPPQPRASAGSVPRRTSTASSAWQYFLPDLNHEFWLAVFPAGPQPAHNHEHTVTNTTTNTITNAVTNTQPQAQRHIYSTQPQHTTTTYSHSTQPQHTITITAHNPGTHNQSREPEKSRPWQRAPHHGMKTHD